MQHLEQLFIRANAAMQAAKNILLITHYNPDGDALASACALAVYLDSLEKPFTLYCHTEPPKNFHFLPHAKDFVYREDLNKNLKADLPLNFSTFDLIIVLDCGELARTKLEKEILNRRHDQTVIEFDHHPKIDSYAEIEIRESSSAATAEVIYHFFQANRLPLNKRLANILLTGLLTDTANFLYPSTSSGTIEAAAKLVRHGAQLHRITDHTLRNKSLEAMKLWGRVMANLQINKKYNFAVTVLPKEEFIDNQIDKEELEGISGFLSNLHGVNGLLFLREENDGFLKGSLRTSRPKGDISKLAKLLGGGGHAKASGFSFKGSLKKIGNKWQII